MSSSHSRNRSIEMTSVVTHSIYSPTAANQKPVIIWDVGGVIMEWNPSKFSESYEGGRFKEQCLAILTSENWKKFDRGDLSYYDLKEIYSKQFSWTEEAVDHLLQAAFHALKPQWSVIEIIKKLKALGYEQYCLTNGSVEYYDYVTGEVYHKAYQFSLLELFNKDQILVSARYKLAKPEREMYELAEQLFSIQSKKRIFVDDNKVNVIGALEAGWWKGIHLAKVEDCLSQLKLLGVVIDNTPESDEENKKDIASPGQPFYDVKL